MLGPTLFGGRALLPVSMLGKMSPWKAHTPSNDAVHWSVLTWDANSFYYPPRTLIGAAYRSGEVPLWNPYQMCGMPLLADAQSAALYPPNLLYAVLPPDITVGILAALHLLAAGAFMYLFLQGMKVSPTASVFGGIAFMMSGFAITWLESPAFLSVGVWLPLSLHLSRSAHERGSIYYAAAAGLTIALSLLGGHVQIAFYGLLAVGLYWAYLNISNKPWRLVRSDASVAERSGAAEAPSQLSKKPSNHQGASILQSFMLALTVFAVGFALAAPQLLSTFELSALSHRGGHPATAAGYTGFSSTAMPLGNLIGLYIPDFFGNQAKGTFWGFNEYAEYCAYVGVLTLLLLPLAFRSKGDRRRQSYFFGGLIVLALLMALGAGINRAFYFLVPGFSGFGSPARVLFLFVFSASVLGSMGLDSVLGEIGEKRPRSIGWLSVAGLGVIVFVAAMFFYNLSRLSTQLTIGDLVSLLSNELRLFIVFFLAGLGVTLLMLTRKLSKGLGIALVICILVADLLSFGFKYNLTGARSEVFPPTAITDFLRKDSDYARVMPLNEKWSLRTFPESVLPPNSASVYRLYDVQGYTSLYPLRYKTLLDAAAGGNSCPPENGNMVFARNPESPVYDLLGVRWIVSMKPLSSHVDEIDGCYVYRNPDALPRAFVARDVKVADDAETLRRILAKENNLRTTVLVRSEDARGLNPWRGVTPRAASDRTRQDQVEIRDCTFNTVTVKAVVSQPGILVLTDQHYPGWNAYVDGKYEPVTRVDYDFRGIPLAAGEHTVIFKYEPRSFRTGLGFALFAIVGLLALGITGIAGRKRHQTFGVRR